MSLAECPEPSIVVDRGLALHKVLRLLVLGLGGGSFQLSLEMVEIVELGRVLLKRFFCFGNALTSQSL